jgi:F-type H+-transporting ATPase subunit b
LVTAPRLRWLLVMAVVAMAALFGGDLAWAEGAPEGASGGLPQFNSAFFLTQLFWLAVIFGTFYILVQGVGVPTVVRVLEARDSKIAFDIARAQELRNEASAVAAMIDDKIIHARDHARTILSLASREAKSVATARLAMFDARIGGQVRDAERRISHAREDALKELPELAGDLVQDVIGRLAQQSVAPERVASTIRTVIKERAS